MDQGNEIIRKLQSDVKSAKSKIKLKNTVTIQQEKLLEEKSESVGILQKEILEIKETAEKVRAENQNLLSKNGELEKKLEESKTIINDNNHGTYDQFSF
jgi:spindle assembly abnormal protein 6